VTDYFPDRWVTLEVDNDPSKVVLLGDEEERSAVDMPQLGAALTRLASELPNWRSGPHNTGPVPLAVFVHSTWPALPPDVLPRLRHDLAKYFDQDRFELAHLAHGDATWPERAPFELPLRVLTLDQEAEQAIAGVASRSWLRRNSPDTDVGVSIERSDWAHLEEALLLGPPIHVLITCNLGEALRRLRDVVEASRPRLLIGLANTPPGALPLEQMLAPVVGTSILAMDGLAPEQQAFVEAVIYGLVHDLPLHEILKSARRTVPTLHDDRNAWLVTTPTGNHDLRMLDALLALRDGATEIQAELGWVSSAPDDEERFLAHAAPVPAPAPAPSAPAPAPAAYGAAPSAPAPSAPAPAPAAPAPVRPDPLAFLSAVKPQLETVARVLETMRPNFSQEQTGLVPLVASQKLLRDVAGALDSARASARQLSSATVAELRERQRRCVDIALQRMRSYAYDLDVAPGNGLARGRPYRIRVHIGYPLPGSIVSGETPSIDKLLPDSERGHELEITVQAKDFRLTSAAVKRLHLPQAGGSKPVYFHVVAPSKPGPAELRVCVFCKNHLLQAFLVSVTIGEEDYLPLPTGGLDARIECARTESFTNIEALPPRALSIGANDTSGTHQFSIKGDLGKEDVSLLPSVFDAQMAQFRGLLEEATWTNATSKTARVFPPLSPHQPLTGDYAKYLRALARQGSNLYDAFYTKSNADLNALKVSEGRVIQIMRYAPEFAFPWAVLYDYDPPPNDKAPVCPGFEWDAAGKSSRCAHGPSEGNVFCAKGFWGLRHVIEELVADPRGANAVLTVNCQAGAPAVQVAANLQIPATKQLVTSLGQQIAPHSVQEGPADDTQLIDLLWNTPAQRAPILIILAHLEDGPATFLPEPDQPRIVLEDGTRWLTVNQLSKQYQKVARALWAQPRSVVLLMVCHSAIGASGTVNNFAHTLSLAGALAVVGTECTVFSELASDFAKELSVALWQSEATIGKAMTQARRGLVEQGNPLAFAFHCLGGADVRLVK
jgi:CHAT domain